MNKKLLRIVGILLVVLVLGSFLFSSIMGGAIRKGVMAIAPRITGTTVALEGVRLFPWTGSGSITGLQIGNPEGFKEDKIMAVGQAHLSLAPFSIISQPIHIKQIRVQDAEIVYERTLTGSNLDALLANIKKNTGASGANPESGSQEANPGPKFMVDEITIAGATVRVATAGVGMTLPMPNLTLRDLGRDRGGITANELAAEIIAAVARQALGAVASGGKAILEGGREGAKKAGEAAGQAVDKVKGLFGK